MEISIFARVICDLTCLGIPLCFLMVRLLKEPACETMGLLVDLCRNHLHFGAVSTAVGAQVLTQQANRL